LSTILVTGGAGYIGSHACKALAASGRIPVTYDSLERGHRDAVRWGPFEQGDILDRDRLDYVIGKYEPAAVLHFAGLAFVGESVADPARYYRNNLAGSLVLLEAMRDNGIRQLVFSSSCATYGSPDAMPIAEDTPQNPINPYGRTKLFVEQMIRDIGTAHDMRWIALRFFNAAGADAEGEIGEHPGTEPRIIPRAIAAALGHAGPFAINGDDYPTPDGTCIRDYVHVTDIARAHVLALEAIEAGIASQPINLGTGRGYSVREVVVTVAKVTGMPVPTTVVGRRPGDPTVLYADPARASEVLGWAPEFPDLADSVLSAWNWEKRLAIARQSDYQVSD
jgi:UDP-glucose-4-epimerase GalE